MARRTDTWSERKFEAWFGEHPQLPEGLIPAEGERGKRGGLLVISMERSLRREVDILGISEDGSLVLIEVKNEPVVRAALGQLLEYLADYDGITYEELNGLCLHPRGQTDGESLRDVFQRFYGTPMPALSAKRYAFLVGPDFRPESAVAVKYLAELLKDRVTLGLLRADKASKGFALSEVHAPHYLRTTTMKEGAFALSPSGTLYRVMAAGQAPVLWRVGKQGEDGKFKPNKGRAMLVVVDRKLIPVDKPPMVDATQTGRVMEKASTPNDFALVVGSVGSVDAGITVLARYKQGAFSGLQVKKTRELKRTWRYSEQQPHEWHEIARLLSEL